MRHRPCKSGSRGFALLMTLMVIAVVISVGLSVLDITIKQVRLSSNARDSEIAFQAAYGGVECARFTRRINAGSMEIENPAPAAVTPTCFQTGALDASRNQERDGTTWVNTFKYRHSWGTGSEPKCSEVDIVILVSSLTESAQILRSDMTLLMPGYPGVGNKVCPVGSTCTVITARGYNRSCPTGANFPPGTVQREVLLEY